MGVDVAGAMVVVLLLLAVGWWYTVKKFPPRGLQEN